MQRMIRTIAIGLCLAGATSLANAAVEPSKEKLIRELLTVTGARNGTADVLLDILGGRLGLPPQENRPASDASQIELYDRYFAESELRGMIDFFRTGTGQHFIDVAPKIAAAARRNLQTTTDRYVAETKQHDLAHRTRNDFRGLGFALKAYFQDRKSFPETKTMGGLAAALVPKYAAAVPSTDVWGRPIRYSVSEDGQHYRLMSAGPDGKFAGRSQLKRSDDIVFSDRGFLQGDDPISTAESEENKIYPTKKENLVAGLLRAIDAQEATTDAVLDIIGARAGLGIAPEETRGEVRESPQMWQIAEETQFRLYETNFTERQLRRLTEFFKSEAGKHYVEASRKIAIETRKSLQAKARR